MPIKYRVDSGPLSQNPSGVVVIDNTAGWARLETMFKVWTDVPTAALSVQREGQIAATTGFTGGDVKTIVDFNAVDGSCSRGEQNPVVFDADGTLFDDLFGDPGVIGFASPCSLGPDGTIRSGLAALNGRYQDNINTATNFEISADVFDAAIIHEFGHLLGLDHSQINVECLAGCGGDAEAGLPTMFPAARPGMKTLAPDDLAWFSKLYPNSSFNQQYGVISGRVLFSDGISQAQGVNVIARSVNDPSTPENESQRIAISVVSGFMFTSNPGQSVTSTYLPCSPPEKCGASGFMGDNSSGSLLGSRDPNLIGYYEIPVPPGAYTIQVESIASQFDEGSSVGPLSPPVPMPGAAPAPVVGPVLVLPGQRLEGVDVLLRLTDPRFDSFEDSGAHLFAPAPLQDLIERAA
jgi:hypothetical protein